MRRFAIAALGTFAFTAGTFAFAAPASAATLPSSHGQPLGLAPVHSVTVNATQSSNWLGYDQGSLEQGGKLFNSVTAEWTVPSATAHAAGQAASSSDWIGIGGGCVDSGCRLTDQTLIQTGTEQDVDSAGAATYSAWWEAIPAPSVTVSSLRVNPGDRVYASIADSVPGLWTITLKDLTSGQSFTTTVPYTSTHATAEWIEESPLMLGTGGIGFSTLPNLANPAFDLATANGSPVRLAPSEQTDLIDSAGHVIGAPSAPDPEGDGFNACAWASTCPAPASGQPTTSSAAAPHRRAGRHHTAVRHRRRRAHARRHTRRRSHRR